VRRTGPFLAVLTLLAALVATPAVASAHHKASATVQKVWRDCKYHNHLTRHYPPKVLAQALAEMPTDVKEYSLCANEIAAAEQAEGSGSRPLPHASANQNAGKHSAHSLHRAEQLGASPVDLGGQKIAAGTVALHGSSLLDTLPTPLLIALVLLIVLGSVPALLRLNRLVRSRRSR
jgi:hypothetical protein